MELPPTESQPAPGPKSCHASLETEKTQDAARASLDNDDEEDEADDEKDERSL